MEKFFVHAKADTVGVAVADIQAGEKVTGWVMEDDSIIELQAKSNIPLGHKIALQDIAKGEMVIKYGQPIGRATDTIARGEHVHVHNLKTARW